MVIIKRLAKPPKPSKGRKKIEIKKIDNKSSQQVTFSKRRAGLFKKASELCILCGAQVAIIVFSPVHKIFCFGHPTTDMVVDRYLMGGQSLEDPAVEGIDNIDEILSIQALNRQYDNAMKELEEEKHKARALVDGESRGSSSSFGGGIFWWEAAMGDDVAEEELEQYVAAMEDLIGRVTMKTEDMMMRSLLQPYVVSAADIGGEHRRGDVTDDGYGISRLLG